MKTHYLIAGGILVLLLMSRQAQANAAKQQITEAIPYDGSNVIGNVWARLSGLGLGGAPGGVNQAGCF